ncbi:MAG: hypothetical protein ACREM2_03085 [Vulcanimicrobiaceae bacterium]
MTIVGALKSRRAGVESNEGLAIARDALDVGCSASSATHRPMTRTAFAAIAIDRLVGGPPRSVHPKVGAIASLRAMHLIAEMSGY